MYRTIDCGTWADPWFADLESDAKLLFLYLFTNPRTTPCGAFEITVRQIEFDTRLASDRIGALLGVLSPKVEWWPKLNVVWLRNFYRRQSANSNAETYKKAAKKALETMPGLVKIAVVGEYPDLRVPLANLKQPTDTLAIPTHEGTDTLPSDTYSFERREEEEQNSEDKSSATTHPFVLLETLCDELGQDVSVLSTPEKNKQLAAAKRLVGANVDERDIRRIVHWLRAQSWLDTGIDLMTVERYLSRWKLDGKPDKPTSKDVDPASLPYNHPRRAAATGKAAIG